MVTPHSFAACGYAGYATVTPHGYATCGHVGYAKHDYATWLCHMWLRRLRQIRLRHMVTPYTGCAQKVKNYVKI